MKLARFFQETLSREFAAIQEASLRRAEREEHRKFSGWPYRAFSALLAGILIYGAYVVFDPGKNLYNLAGFKAAGPTTYFPITSGKIFRAEGAPPNLIVKDTHQVSFDENTERWQKASEVLGFREQGDFWYTFDIDLKDSPLAPLASQEELGILIPKIFGKSTIYRNGEKIDFRKNFRPKIGVTSPRTRLDIHVKSDVKDGSFPGIRALYPIVVGKFADLDKVTDYIDSQAFRVPLALVMQIVALLIICALASAGPYMAELLPAIAFFCVNITDCAFLYLKDNGKLTVSAEHYFGCKALPGSLQGFTFLWFICEFFRKETDAIRRTLSRAVIAWIGFEVFLFILAFRFFTGAEQPWVIVITGNYGFFALATAFTVGRDYLYMWSSRKTLERAILSSILLSSICYFYASGIYNYWHLFTQLTSEFTVQFNNYLAMAVITAIELGRSNRQRDDQRKHLPKESTKSFARLFTHRNYKIHRGFVVLCDGVGYSVKMGQMKTLGPAERAHYQCSVLHFLLERFYHPLTSNHAMTGDGFYFGMQLDWSVDSLTETLSRCKQTVESELNLISYGMSWFGNDSMKFRCTLAYGEYSNSQVVVNTLGAVVASSDLHTYLARTSGSKDDPIALRVYLNSYTRGFADLPFGMRIQSKNKSSEEQISEAVEFTAPEIGKILNEGWIERIVRAAQITTSNVSAA